MNFNLYILNFTTLWTNSADDKLILFFLFFPENKIWHFMQIKVCVVGWSGLILWWIYNFYRHCLWANSAEDILKYFPYFSRKIGFDFSCKLSPKETICMKCQSLFSGKNKKNISGCRLLKFDPSMLSINANRNISTQVSGHNWTSFLCLRLNNICLAFIWERNLTMSILGQISVSTIHIYMYAIFNKYSDRANRPRFFLLKQQFDQDQHYLLFSLGTPKHK